MCHANIKDCHYFWRLISDQTLKLLFGSRYVNFVKLLAQKSELLQIKHHNSTKHNSFDPRRLRFHWRKLGWWWGFLRGNFYWLEDWWRASCHLNSCWLGRSTQPYYDTCITVIRPSLFWSSVSVWNGCLNKTRAAASAECPLISLDSASLLVRLILLDKRGTSLNRGFFKAFCLILQHFFFVN